MASALALWSYVLCSVAVTGFGVFALVFAIIRQKRKGKDTTEFFLTARGTAGAFRIAWSFYAAAMGSWAIFSLPSYAYGYGIVGLVFYAVACGLPILLQGLFGARISRRLPNVMSFTDFVRKRFGDVLMVWVTLIMMLTMGIALTAEMTAVGDLFSDVIGITRVPMVVLIAMVSMIYTAGGGLYVSMITDQLQAGLTLVLLAIFIVFVAATFRVALPPLPKYLGATYPGYSSIATMPISLMSASLFSEAIWQRCWASVSDRKLKQGACWGACQVIIVCFLFGFGGYLAAWSGKFVPSGPDDYGNTIFFTLLKNSDGVQVVWITIVVAILTVILSESAQDSLQNALTNCIAGVFLRNQSVMWSRLLMVVLTVPCLVVSLRGYNINSLFLISNIVTSTAALPIMSGLFTGYWAERIVTPFSTLSGCLSGLISVIVYAAIRSSGWHISVSKSLHLVFFDQYDWPPLIIAVVASGLGLLVAAAIEIPTRMCLGIPLQPSALAKAEANLLDRRAGFSDKELKGFAGRTAIVTEETPMSPSSFQPV